MFKEFLTHKGWISTIIGTLMAVPLIIRVIYVFWNRMSFSEVEIITISVLLAIAMIFIILPSKIELTAGKINFKIED